MGFIEISNSMMALGIFESLRAIIAMGSLMAIDSPLRWKSLWSCFTAPHIKKRINCQAARAHRDFSFEYWKPPENPYATPSGRRLHKP